MHGGLEEDNPREHPYHNQQFTVVFSLSVEELSFEE